MYISGRGMIVCIGIKTWNWSPRKPHFKVLTKNSDFYNYDIMYLIEGPDKWKMTNPVLYLETAYQINAEAMHQHILVAAKF